MELVSRFEQTEPFPLDDFQRRAAESLAEGRSVLTCAPTGAGKTVVGEFGVWLALETGGKAFYTTPLKALSNQKFGDFIARHGASNVGLLTGDNSINGDAPVVVMTTEVLRNMLYERSPTLDRLQVVVMDEVHYLKDPYRGATWEEVLIHLPSEVQVVALSATVSNAEEFGDWLRTVRGETDVVIERTRPVPIEHRYMVGEKMTPMFVGEGRPNPSLLRAERDARPRARDGRTHGRDRRRGPRGAYRANRVDVVERLEAERLLPAIVFIFSRAGCDQAVEELRRANLKLTNAEERERIREYVEMRTANALPERDLEVLGYEGWVDGLLRGAAAHHAGMIPLFKETVEELFEKSLVKVVFATETLALGINMPAKTVVIERLMKWTGEKHEMMQAADYTQLTGRAGRRGLDVVGYGVTLYQRDIPFARIAALAGGTSFPLVSSFRPSYNMAVNLLRVYTRAEAEHLLNLSFAQFLADKSVVKQERAIERNERFIAAYRENAACDRGDIEEYWRIARRLRGAERAEGERYRRDRARVIRTAFESLRPGQVVLVRRGPRAGLAAVLSVRHGKGDEPQPVVVTEDRKLTRLALRDFREPPTVVGEIRLPSSPPRSPRFRHEVAQLLAGIDGDAVRARASKPQPVSSRELREHSRELSAHPVFDCPDRGEHERWMQRVEGLLAETEALRSRVGKRTGTLARMFQRVLDVLEALGYVEGDRPTEKGAGLARIYNESDLLVAEALSDGVLDGLKPPEIAAVVSSLVYETRLGVPELDAPNDRVRRAYGRLERLWRDINRAESQRGLELVREPDPGFIGRIYDWAAGEALEDVLGEGEMSAGDFVRSTKQVWDLLRQLQDVTDGELSSRCGEAARSIYRGVVAYSGTL